MFNHDNASCRPLSGDMDNTQALSQPLLSSDREAGLNGTSGSLDNPGKGKTLSVLSAAEGREALEEHGINGASPRSAVGSQARLF